MNRRNLLKQISLLPLLYLMPRVLSRSFGIQCQDPIHHEIENNHRHLLIVPLAHVQKAEPQQYDIQGASRHTHFIDISKEQFEELKEKGILHLTSTENAMHAHSITLTCAESG